MRVELRVRGIAVPLAPDPPPPALLADAARSIGVRGGSEEATVGGDEEGIVGRVDPESVDMGRFGGEGGTTGARRVVLAAGHEEQGGDAKQDHHPDSSRLVLRRLHSAKIIRLSYAQSDFR